MKKRFFKKNAFWAGLLMVALLAFAGYASGWLCRQLGTSATQAEKVHAAQADTISESGQTAQAYIFAVYEPELLTTQI